MADEGVFETLVADAAEVRRQLDEMEARERDPRRGARRRSSGPSTTSPPRSRAFAESAAPDANADDLRMARRDLETRREALARIDAELDRVAGRLEQASRASTRSPPSTHELGAAHERIGAGSLPARTRRDRGGA